MNIKEIKQLLSLIAENEVSEFELEREGTRISIKKYSMPPQMQAPIMQTISDNYIARPQMMEDTSKSDQKPKVTDDNIVNIISPIVGTFYAAQSPEAAPFVSIGSKVTANDTVCIVEAMKVMNEIKAEVNGTIEQILVENGQAVEYGQVLFRVRK